MVEEDDTAPCDGTILNTSRRPITLVHGTTTRLDDTVEVLSPFPLGHVTDVRWVVPPVPHVDGRHMPLSLVARPGTVTTTVTPRVRETGTHVPLVGTFVLTDVPVKVGGTGGPVTLRPRV